MEVGHLWGPAGGGLLPGGRAGDLRTSAGLDPGVLHHRLVLGAVMPPKLPEEDGEPLGQHQVGLGLVLGEDGPLWVLRCLRLEYLRARAGWPWESSEVLDLAACCSRVLKSARLLGLVTGRFPELGSLEDDKDGEPREQNFLTRRARKRCFSVGKPRKKTKSLE